MSYADAMITVENFIKRYGDFTAVDNVSFEVKRGSIFAFLGPNGAGKSTTINTLCTIVEKTSGNLFIDGKSVSKEQDAVRKVIGVVFQESTLDRMMTVEENLQMHAHFYGLPKMGIDERIQSALDIVDMADWRKAMVSSLSGGMKRRVEIARSLLHEPKILFLDEPTTGLDPQTRANIWDYMVKLQQERKMTIFLTTHYMDEAEISDQVAVMDHGRIIALDRPGVLKREYTNDRAEITTRNEDDLKRLLMQYNLPYKKEENCFIIEVEQIDTLMDLISTHKSFIEDFEFKKGTLNDVFLEITGRDMRG